MDQPTVDESLDAAIASMLVKWPKMSHVFINNHMGCIGCAFARFHTLQDACDAYQLDKGSLVDQMRDCLRTQDKMDTSTSMTE